MRERRARETGRGGGDHGDAEAGRRQPRAAAAPLSLAGGAVLTGKAEGLKPLESAAGPLLALLTRLRSTIAHPARASLRAQLLAYLRQFEERAEAAGVVRNDVLLARYALCTALDEAVSSTPWGGTSVWGKQSLLITVHNEAAQVGQQLCAQTAAFSAMGPLVNRELAGSSIS
ncbi:hypothetical protein B1218_32570, partial [Pseudomonas ogarae]